MGKILAYIIPTLILLIILYLNFLPFGYYDEQIIDAGGQKDTEGVFFLESNEGLGEKFEIEEETFRDVDKLIYALYQTNKILRNADVEISLSGKDVHLRQQPPLGFEWDYEWKGKEFLNDFKIYNINITGEETKTNRKPLVMNDCVKLNGKTRLVLPRTINRFQEGPFAVYVEWIPQKNSDHQQIIGHFNWEIYQNKDNVIFNIARTTEGERYSAIYNVDSTFYDQKNSLLAIYNPTEKQNYVGYIELFVNNFSTGKIYIGDEEIEKNYGKENLSLGWTSHSGRERPPLEGEICNVKFSYIELEGIKTTHAKFQTIIAQSIRIPILGEGNLEKVEIKVER